MLLSSDGVGPSDQEDGEVMLQVLTRNLEEYKSAKKDLKKAMLEHYWWVVSISLSTYFERLSFA